jgi:hypothetical protein
MRNEELRRKITPWFVSAFSFGPFCALCGEKQFAVQSWEFGPKDINLFFLRVSVTPW